jgi:hypothetical protein
VTDRECPICLGFGWVCENHPHSAWSEEFGCQCGAGVPCKCNDVEEPDVGEVLIEEDKITRH